MGDAKRILCKPITSRQARPLVRKLHYSKKVVQNSSLNIGVYYAGNLEGVMQFGSPLDRRKVLPLVRGTLWNQMLELNRMAFSDALPRNSESRAMAVAFRMLRRHRPDIKWVISFADATQCGDGTIYRAAGFVLTGIKKNTGTFLLPDGRVVQRMSLELAVTTRISRELRAKYNMPTQPAAALVKAAGGQPIPGYQFRYIRFLDPTWDSRLTVPVIPFKDIPDDARMYLGRKKKGEYASARQRDPGNPLGEGGAEPTLTLHPPTTDGA